jgi:hypothetical protein
MRKGSLSRHFQTAGERLSKARCAGRQLQSNRGDPWRFSGYAEFVKAVFPVWRKNSAKTKISRKNIAIRACRADESQLVHTQRAGHQSGDEPSRRSPACQGMSA